MRMGRKWGVAVGILVSLAGWSASSQAADFATCVRTAADMDLRAKMSFQAGMRDLITRGNPAFSTLATLSMEYQVAAARRRRAELDYLVNSHPDRVRTTAGVAAFTNFDWSKADSERLSGESPGYRKLKETMSTLRSKTDGHPDWPKLRRYFHSDLARSEAFKALMRRFSVDRRAVATAIASCPPA